MMTSDPVPVLTRFSEAEKIGYPLLSDADNVVIPAFGVANERFPKGSPWYGIAHPVILVVNAEGVVRHRFYEPDYSERPDAETILELLKRGTAPGDRAARRPASAGPYRPVVSATIFAGVTG